MTAKSIIRQFAKLQVQKRSLVGAIYKKTRLTAMLGSLALMLVLSASSAFAKYKPKNISVDNTNRIQKIIDAHNEAKKHTMNLSDIPLSQDTTVFPSYDPSYNRGKAVFKKNCAMCHGRRDDKSKPGAMLSKAYMKTRSPLEQFNSVTNGHKNMPPFKDVLTRTQRWDAIMYFRAEMLGYFDASSAEKKKLNSIFGGNCAVCHGLRGHGDGNLHKSLNPPPANFNQFNRLYTRSDNDLHAEITNGIPWSAMPAWKNRVDFDKHYTFDPVLITKLVRYVRQFGYSLEEDRLDKGRSNLEQLKQTYKKAEGQK